MHENNIVWLGCDGAESVRDRLLALFAAFHQLHPFLQHVGRLFFQARAETGNFCLPQGDPDFRHSGHGGKLPQAVNENGGARQFGELLRRRGLFPRRNQWGHTRAQTGRRQDDKYSHRKASIRADAPLVQTGRFALEFQQAPCSHSSSRS